MARRPIRSREAGWAKTIAAFLAARRIRPNWISFCGVGFSLLAGAAFCAPRFAGPLWQQIALLAVATVCTPLRLLCNLFDGMVAVEGGMKTASGELYNDFTDRVSDVMIFVGAGYGITAFSWGPALGWGTAVLAVSTAYMRTLSGAAGATQRFFGPMAKSHRMAVLIVAGLISIWERATGLEGRAIPVALAVIALGCVVTILRRFLTAARELEHGG